MSPLSNYINICFKTFKSTPLSEYILINIIIDFSKIKNERQF